MLKKLSFSRQAILPGICFLCALVVGVPFLIGKIFFHTGDSLYTTQYIFFGYLAFFFLFLGIIIPVMRWFFWFLKIRKTNLFDIFATVLLVFSSSFLFIILVPLTLLCMSVFKKYKYFIYNWGSSASLIFMGIIPRHHGRLENGVIGILNHTSPAEYTVASQAAGTKPWNIVAGKNLSENTKTIEDRIIKNTIGRVVKKYAIQIDRTSGESRVGTARSIKSEYDQGKNILIFVEGTRLTFKQIVEQQKLLLDFQDGAFRIAFKYKIPIQPIVLDWPAIYRTKDDYRWGVRPSIIDIYFLEKVNPENFETYDELKKHCWNLMYQQLKNSKKIQRFQNGLNS
ncbi:MAG: 1-acyl-sn-glycerol-3-phosphate acyltransferase [bacterium]